MHFIGEYTDSSSSPSSSVNDEDEKEKDTINIVNAVKTKRRSILPPASSLLDFGDGTDTRTSTSSEPKAKRIRSIPHIEGNWATHVFVECDALTSTMKNDMLQEIEKAGLGVHFEPIEAPHMSLSRLGMVKYHEIEPLWRRIEEYLSEITSVDVVFDHIEYFSNDEKTRYFVAICGSLCPELFAIYDAINRAFSDFGLQAYYDDPTPHISIVWTLEALPIGSDAVPVRMDGILPLSMTIDRVCVKSGEKLCEIRLL